MRPRNIDDIPLPPSSQDLKDAGFTLRERTGLRFMDIAAVFIQSNPVYGENWPSQNELNKKIGNCGVVSTVVAMPGQSNDDVIK